MKEKMTFEQYIEANKEILFKSFKELKEEDFIKINAVNPEDQNWIIEQRLHKSQYEKLKKDSVDLGIPVEELAFITSMYTLEASEITPKSMKIEIKAFINRQLARIKNNINKKLIENIQNITIKQFKDKLHEEQSIPIKRLGNMEQSWREEFKKGKSEYKDEDIYVKVKLASMLNKLK